MLLHVFIITLTIGMIPVFAEPSNPYTFNTSMLSDTIYQKIDRFRTVYVNETAGLERDHILDKISLLHSIDMATNNYIAHVNLQGMNPTDRANYHNYTCQQPILEIASKLGSFHRFDVNTMTYDWLTHEELSHKILKKFFSSPKGHGEVILDQSTSYIGIGIVQSHNQMIITTVMFC